MSLPTPIVKTIEPTKAKAWVAALGAMLTVAIPYILSVATYLPDPWPAIIGGIIGVLTVLGVYQTPNAPKDTSIVPNDQIKTLPPNVGYTPVPDAPVDGGKTPW